MTEENTTLDFTAEEFADYWESVHDDEQSGIDFMAKTVVTDEGRELLSSTVTTLADRHGVSSGNVKTFRTALRKACQKAGIEDIYSPKKTKCVDEITGIPGYKMVLKPSVPHSKPAGVDLHAKLIKRMMAWVNKGECSIADLEEAVNILVRSV